MDIKNTQVGFNQSTTEAVALGANANASTIYFTKDKSSIVLNGKVYGGGTVTSASQIMDNNFSYISEEPARMQNNINMYLGSMVNNMSYALNNNVVHSINGKRGTVTLNAADLGLSGAYVYKGSVSDINTLWQKVKDDEAEDGWVYNVSDTGMNYAVLTTTTNSYDFANQTFVANGSGDIHVPNFLTHLGLSENLSMVYGQVYVNTDRTTIDGVLYAPGTLKYAFTEASQDGYMVMAVRDIGNHDRWKLLALRSVTDENWYYMTTAELGGDALPDTKATSVSQMCFYCTTPVKGYILDALGSTLTIDPATSLNNGLMSNTDKAKLDSLYTILGVVAPLYSDNGGLKLKLGDGLIISSNALRVNYSDRFIINGDGELDLPQSMRKAFTWQ